MSKKEIKNGLVVNDVGDKSWYKNDVLHRDNDLPAIEWTSGTKQWWINGKLHREDGPAIEYRNGDKFWYMDGRLNRENGPAAEFIDGTKQWWILGKKLSQEQFNHYVEMKILNEQLHQNLKINNLQIKLPKI